LTFGLPPFFSSGQTFLKRRLSARSTAGQGTPGNDCCGFLNFSLDTALFSGQTRKHFTGLARLHGIFSGIRAGVLQQTFPQGLLDVRRHRSQKIGKDNNISPVSLQG
jgi:hypothetical protein